MNKFIAAVSFDHSALALISIASIIVVGEAYTRTSLGDAQTAREARYPPLSSIITEGELKVFVCSNGQSACSRSSLSLSIFCPSPRFRTSLTIPIDHVRELEKNNLVVIHDVLSETTLKRARENVERLSDEMDVSNHSNDLDVRQ